MTAAITKNPTDDTPTPRFRINGAVIGGIVLVFMMIACIATLPVTLGYVSLNNDLGLPLQMEAYDETDLDHTLQPPSMYDPMGTDRLGRSMLSRSLLGGSISLGIGLAAAAITTFIGTAWGLISGYAGGRVDAFMMRTVDVLYGLPYILLVVLLAVALQPAMEQVLPSTAANVITLLIAIGAVSWLTLARVVRGQVLSLRNQPFVEAARATGAGPVHIMIRHVLPNLIGPVIVYTTLTVPQAILQESFLSFLGIGVRPPLPSWGNLAADGLAEMNPVKGHPWLLAFPCLLLAVTLLALNFVGDGLRDRFDPRAKHRM